MYSLIQLLRHIGLSEKEAITYLINLKIGTNPASVIAKHAELNRCTTYSILESLVKKGLVNQFEKDKIRYFTAVEPKQLLNYIEEKKRDLVYFSQEIENFLPEFESLKHPYQVMPIVKSFTGKTGLLKLYNEVLKESIISIWAVSSKNHNDFFKRFVPIYLRDPKTIRLLRKGDKNTEKIALSSTDDIKKIKPCMPIEFIGMKKVFLLSYNEPYGIELSNQEIVKNFQEKFNEIWNK